jgi:hypothetical protein
MTKLLGLTTLSSKLTLAAMLIGSTQASAFSVCEVTTFAKLKTTIADSNALTTRLISLQKTASSLRQRIMSNYAQLTLNLLGDQRAQLALFSVPYSSDRSMYCSELSRDMSYDRSSYNNSMYGVSYTRQHMSESLYMLSQDFSSACVTQAAADLDAAVRQDIADLSLMFKTLPSVPSLCSYLPR